MAKTRKGAGGKLQRSEVVQTRMSPRLRFLAEIMARHQHRSLSSLIEQLIAQAAEQYPISITMADKPALPQELFPEKQYQTMPLTRVAGQLWSLEASQRFAALAFFLPDLLTHEEERLWSALKKTPFFWLHFVVKLMTREGKLISSELRPIYDFRGLVHERLKEAWPDLDAFLQGQQSLETAMAPWQDLLPHAAVEKPDYYAYPLEEIVANAGAAS